MGFCEPAESHFLCKIALPTELFHGLAWVDYKLERKRTGIFSIRLLTTEALLSELGALRLGSRRLLVVIAGSGGRALQFLTTKQLCIRSHDDSGEAHGDCTNAHGQIESPSDQKASGDRDSDKVIGGRPNGILNHLSIRRTRLFYRCHDATRIAAHQHNSSRLDCPDQAAAHGG